MRNRGNDDACLLSLSISFSQVDISAAFLLFCSVSQKSVSGRLLLLHTVDYLALYEYVVPAANKIILTLTCFYESEKVIDCKNPLEEANVSSIEFIHPNLPISPVSFLIAFITNLFLERSSIVPTCDGRAKVVHSSVDIYGSLHICIWHSLFCGTQETNALRAFGEAYTTPCTLRLVDKDSEQHRST